MRVYFEKPDQWVGMWIPPTEIGGVGTMTRWFADGTPVWDIEMSPTAYETFILDSEKNGAIRVTYDQAKALFPQATILPDTDPDAKPDPASHDMYLAECERANFSGRMIKSVWDGCELDARINMLDQLRSAPTAYPYGDPW